MTSHTFDEENFDSIREYLEDIPLNELIFQTELILDELSWGDKVNFSLHHFCHSYLDRQSRIQFVETLFNEGILQNLDLTIDSPLNFKRPKRSQKKS